MARPRPSSAANAAPRARQKAQKGERDARRARASRPGRLLARIGLFSRAVVYVVLGYLAADIAAGNGRGKNASSQGALVEIAREPVGPALVVLLAAGFLAYAAWRFLQAAAGDESEEGGADAAKRLGWAGIGALYVVLAVRALLLFADGGSGGNSNSAFSASRTLLDVGGPALLATVGIGVAAGGLALSVWAVRHDFTKRLDQGRMPRELVGASRVVEVFGNVVRGLAVAGIGA